MCVWDWRRGARLAPPHCSRTSWPLAVVAGLGGGQVEKPLAGTGLHWQSLTATTSQVVMEKTSEKRRSPSLLAM
jgi:hypothetical protein